MCPMLLELDFFGNSTWRRKLFSFFFMFCALCLSSTNRLSTSHLHSNSACAVYHNSQIVGGLMLLLLLCVFKWTWVQWEPVSWMWYFFTSRCLLSASPALVLAPASFGPLPPFPLSVSSSPAPSPPSVFYDPGSPCILTLQREKHHFKSTKEKKNPVDL